MSSDIPVVDFASVLTASGGDQRKRNGVVQELHSAFTTVGFVFIKNHGISEALIEKAFSVSAEFFSLALEEKAKYPREDSCGGYLGLEQEFPDDPSKPADLKESFDVYSIAATQYPDVEVQSFRPMVAEFYKACSEVSLQILQLMAEALKLQDPQFFNKHHVMIGRGTEKNFTLLRFLHYPPLTASIKPGQLRCGEHVDYSSITLLFQAPTGGLQVKRSDGGYIDVPYVDGTVLVNLGGLMQNWTSDIYLATPHRVLIPEDELKRQSVRRSIAFFVHPDNEALVECIDGSNKYPPITAAEDARQHLDKAL